MDYGEAQRWIERGDWWSDATSDAGAPDIIGQLDALKQLAKEDRLPEHGEAIWYALVQRLRYLGDYYERDLIQHLRHEAKGNSPDGHYTWAEVSKAVQANLSSPQAAYAKWKRLLEPDRRVAGAPGRGGWTKGKSRN